MRHMQSDHADVEFDDEGAAELVEHQAYAASDS
jgi:hypothetical protein